MGNLGWRAKSGEISGVRQQVAASPTSQPASPEQTSIGQAAANQSGLGGYGGTTRLTNGSFGQAYAGRAGGRGARARQSAKPATTPAEQAKQAFPFSQTQPSQVERLVEATGRPESASTQPARAAATQPASQSLALGQAQMQQQVRRRLAKLVITVNQSTALDQLQVSPPDGRGASAAQANGPASSQPSQ